jgi:hypothetical protein
VKHGRQADLERDENIGLTDESPDAFSDFDLGSSMLVECVSIFVNNRNDPTWNGVKPDIDDM